ncbi:hypothetical protein H6P81_018997 [Aristolochia fimbriata]|uniref:Uncharacterized protein n=1 Tax=Aristolochia fimbriata TaxID=158543 RepID=A0AAV7E3J1_ARIFI|nr:hypothetical protein H6P81_018997 [Aristolochia fimbriata]
MGCTGSKLDDLPAVSLCRDRYLLLDEAIRLRFALADAHVAYIHALRSIGFSLQRFFDGPFDAPPSPILPLPTHRKGDPDPLPLPDPDFVPPVAAVPPPAVASPLPPSHSHSNSGSHIHFHSDSDDEGSHLSGEDSSPLHDHEAPHTEYTYNYNFMRSQPPPASVSYEQHPRNPRTVQMTDSSYGYVPYAYPYQNSNAYSYPYTYPPPPQGGGGGMSSFFGSPSAYPGYPSSSSPPPPQRPSGGSDGASSSKAPPPPPSPPRASTWDFLNFFETNNDSFYPSQYTPSRDSKDVREEEGIPDLEDEEFQHEVVKEVYGEQKLVDSAGPGYSKVAPVEEEKRISGDGEEGGGLEYEVHMMDKNVVEKEVKAEERSNATAFKARGSLAVPEVVREIKAQFDRAAESANEISKMLEAGKLPYHRKGAAHRASSKMLNVITPSLSVVASQASIGEPSSAGKGGSFLVDLDEGKGMAAGNLSCTLEKLYIWEKKLYEEVKAEERMRIVLERKCRRLKHLDERGAEAHKLEAIQTVIRKLSTKIRIAIQVVDSISSRINKLRDEELWPQIDELIHGLIIMWKVMLECHQSQCQAISDARSLDAIASSEKLGQTHMEATLQLERDLLNWISCFYTWVCTQKGYVRALNGWLLKCLHQEPEVTPDGVAPFSPGRIGAPPVFVICNQWAQAMERISENEVVEAMQAFSSSVLGLWDRQKAEQQPVAMAHKDMDRRMKVLEKEEQRIQRDLDTVNKKLVFVSEQVGVPMPEQIVHNAHGASNGSLQGGLKLIFAAMERFSADSVKAYEELRVRTEEDRLARENAKVP